MDDDDAGLVTEEDDDDDLGPYLPTYLPTFSDKVWPCFMAT